jgi:cytochrome P450
VLTQPGLLDRVRSTPAISGSVVEEVLRFESPIQRGWRRVTRDVELHGQTLKAGDLVYVMLGAANRDERRFDDAATFHAERRRNQHLGFGHGIHFCVGAPLARLEALAALERLTERLEHLCMMGAVSWLPSVHQRTLARLAVQFSPRRALPDRTGLSETLPRTTP